MPKRIAILSPHFCEYSFRLAVAMAQSGSVLLVVDLDKLKAEAPHGLPELSKAGVSVVNYQRNTQFSRFASAIQSILSLLFFKPELIIAHEQSASMPALLTIFSSYIAPLRLIIHDPMPHAGEDTRRRSKAQRLVETARRRAQDFIVHGEHCRNELIRALPASEMRRIISIPHGILLSPSTADLKKPQPRSILFFGRLEAYKGLRTLLNAADAVAKRVPDFSLRIIGSGPEGAWLRDACAQRPYLSFSEGFSSAPSVISAMQRAQLVVLPYDEATQSGVLSVAYANRRPVVATSVGSLSEVISQGGGVLVPPGDPSALAAAIEKCLLDDSLWSKLSDEAQYVSQTYMCWSNIAALVGSRLRPCKASNKATGNSKHDFR